METESRALDPCSGTRMFYFDKHDPRVLFCDNRRVSKMRCDGRALNVEPDILLDVCDMPFDDETFPLVIFDPPHLTRGAGWQAEAYGVLPADWKTFLKEAFAECWRVLAPNGTLIFKWNDYHVPLKDVLACAPAKPICGNRRPQGAKTHWLVFLKVDGPPNDEDES